MRTLDQQLSKEDPASRQLYASAEKMHNADRKLTVSGTAQCTIRGNTITNSISNTITKHLL